MSKSLIQTNADEIVYAAQFDLERVSELESEHGQCINFAKYGKERRWIFEDKYELKIKE